MSIAFQASPNGKKSGIVVVGNNLKQFVTVVLPKIWRNSPPKTHLIDWPKDQKRYFICMHEGDKCVIKNAGQNSQLINQALSASAANANQKLGIDTETSVPLLQPIAPLTKFTESYDSVNYTGLNEIFSILELTKRGMLFAQPKQLLAGRPAIVRFLRPYLYQLFLNEVKKNLKFIKREYISIKGETAVIKGRVVEKSLINYLSNLNPKFECIFDNFTAETPLFRVIVTALGIVTQGNFENSVFNHKKELTKIIVDAAKIRRILCDIDSLTPYEAILAAQRIRFDALTIRWKEALFLANIIIKGIEYKPDLSVQQNFTSFEIDVPTDKLWEYILLSAFKVQAGNGVFHSIIDGNMPNPELIDVPSPWKFKNLRAADKSYPDIVLQHKHNGTCDTLCIDAKYKFIEYSNIPYRSDLYQIFAYSHLTKVLSILSGCTETVDLCVLIYPTTGEGTIVQTGIRERVDGKSPILLTMTLPYPHPDDLINHKVWKIYLSKVGKRFKELLIEAN